jgi:hypothetical protein
VLRILLVALLGAGLAALVVLPMRTAFLVALLVMLLALLLGAAKLAVDLVDLTASDLIADSALLVVVGLAFTRMPAGDRTVTAALFAAALGTQALPLVLAHARPRHA